MNKEIKAEFRKSIYNNGNSVVDVISSFFNEIEPLENQLQKDVSQFTVSESEKILEYEDFDDIHRIYTIRFGLSLYIDYCRENNLFEGITGAVLDVVTPSIDPSKAIAKSFFKDEEDLLTSLRKVTQFDNGYPEPVYLALAWLGLERKQIISLTDNQVDLENRKIYNEKGNVIVDGFSDRIFEILNDFATRRTGERENGQTKYTVYKDTSYDRFLKKFNVANSAKMGKPITDTQISATINKMNVRYVSLGNKPKLTHSNVWKCGRFYELYELEQGGIDVFTKENAELVEKVFHNQKKAASILWTYKRYKTAFDLA